MLNNRIVMCLAAAVGVLVGGAAQADVFNMGPGLTSLEMVPVGNPGNAGEGSGISYGGWGLDAIVGAVNYAYQMGKYEVTNAQWREFLTAKAAVGDPNGLYSVSMAGVNGGIARVGSGTAGNPYVYSAKGGDSNWDNRPVNYVTFWDAARFANWLHNGQGNGDTESGAYTNIGNQSTFARQSGAQYFIPTENEWYKAAYHKNDGVTGNYFEYPTSSDVPPINTLVSPDPGNHANFYDFDDTGNGGYTIGSPYGTTNVGDFENSPSPYGTFDQGGNVWEWNETSIDGWSRGMRGGDWGALSHFFLPASSRYGSAPANEYDYDVDWWAFGFRVASVPEPGSITLLVCGAVAGLIWWRRRR